MRFFCWFGLHRWFAYTNAYSNKVRICCVCKKFQQFDEKWRDE